MIECHQESLEELFDIQFISKLIMLREDKVHRFLYKKRKYTLSSHVNYNIFTGKTKDNLSILCLGGNHTICLIFDKNGNYQDSKIIEKYLDELEDINEALGDELAFKDAPIKFKQFSFSHNENKIEILPFNNWILEFIENGESLEGKEKERNIEIVKDWIFGNCYILNCWNDYWVDANGEITDS